MNKNVFKAIKMFLFGWIILGLVIAIYLQVVSGSVREMNAISGVDSNGLDTAKYINSAEVDFNGVRYERYK